MDLAIIGYGKMGKEIETIAVSRGHKVVAVIDQEGISPENSSLFSKADVAVEFTTPETAVNNYLSCFEHQVPVVSGTTGWLNEREKVHKTCCVMGGGFFYASNFSLGVNLFFELNKKLAKLMAGYSDYKVSMEEVHHTQKKDAPSGTAISLATHILKETEELNGWVCNEVGSENQLPITAMRVDNVPGTHTIKFDSPVDCIEISHRAKSRTGFALGAVLAAEFMVGKQGVFGMKDFLKLEI